MRIAVLCAALFTFGCGSQLKPDTFMVTVRSYNEDLRWRRLPSAASKLPPAQRLSFLDEREALEDDLRIDDWEVKRVRWSGDRLRARVQVRYTWHSDRRGIVRKTTALQRWERHGKRWLMVEEYQLRGHDMPGLAKRDKTAKDDQPVEPRP